MSNLNITERRSDSVVVLDLQGVIRIGEGSVKLRQAVRELVEKGEKNIVINLAGVSNIDSSGLGELVSCYSTVQRIGGGLKLLNLSQNVIDIMSITKLLTVFDTYDDEAAAIESFR